MKFVINKLEKEVHMKKRGFFLSSHFLNVFKHAVVFGNEILKYCPRIIKLRVAYFYPIAYSIDLVQLRYSSCY